jgi:UDP-glucose:(glucosyl)LPS alpha-1,2-glucosyltransferase
MTNLSIGAQQIADRIQNDCDQELLDKVQVFHNSTFDEEIDDTKRSVLIVHTDPHHPDVEHLQDNGWNKFDKLVFVSHWQQEQFYMYMGIPYSKGTVIYNGIDIIPPHEKPNLKDNKLKLVYFTSPDRGLDYLFCAFDEITKDHDNVHLDVYCSFDECDEAFKDVKTRIKNHPNITLSTMIPHNKMVKALEDVHIFAYPCVVPETFCLPLAEALSAGCYCIHPAIGALKETNIGLTQMYSFEDGRQAHLDKFYIELRKAIMLHENAHEYVVENTTTTKAVADFKFDWENKKAQWNQLLKVLTFN